jgi:hypothetical protein
MLIIRREQVDAFSPLIRKKFVDEVLEYIRGYYPEDCEALGDEQMRRAIDFGIDRAAAHGFDIKGDVCSYITLMFSLGSYFDEDPLVPWAAEVLEDNETDRSTVMERLYAKARNYLRMVAGENGQYYRSALLSLRRKSFDSLTATGTGDMDQDIRIALSELYPEQYQASSEDTLKGVIVSAKELAGKYELGTREGIMIYVRLMFMLGSHVDRDLLHPWAAEILQIDSGADPVSKAQRLYEAAMARIEQAFRIARSTRST